MNHARVGSAIRTDTTRLAVIRAAIADFGHAKVRAIQIGITRLAIIRATIAAAAKPKIGAFKVVYTRVALIRSIKAGGITEPVHIGGKFNDGHLKLPSINQPIGARGWERHPLDFHPGIGNRRGIDNGDSRQIIVGTVAGGH